MKYFVWGVVLLLGPETARSAQPEPSSFASVDFHYTDARTLKENPAAPTPPASGSPRTGVDSVDKPHLNVNCGDEELLGSAADKAQYEEAVAFWKGILVRNGMMVGFTPYDGKNFRIPYYHTTGDETVVRCMEANPKQFKPKDEASLRENKAMVEGELSKTHKIILSHLVQRDYRPATYKTYYITKFEPRGGQAETQLRVLDRREQKLDFDVLEKAGVRVIQKPAPGMMVYLGKQINLDGVSGQTRDEAERALTIEVASLVRSGKTIIGTKISESPTGSGFAGRIYYNP